jgi:nicotinamide riboside kinase
MKRIAIVGAESTGKSTLASLLTGRLRTHGVLAALVAESGSELPFHPSMLDSKHEAHAYMISAKMAAEARAMLRRNVSLLISDRSPLDHAAYYRVRFSETPTMRALCDAAALWAREYEAIYFLPIEGATYVEDGFRQAAAQNDYRDRVDAWLRKHVLDLPNGTNTVVEVKGSFRDRCEFVYQHVLSWYLHKSRPLRAYEQVRDWLRMRGFRIVEVRPQGSHSVMRFHPAGDHDDIDAIVVVDGDANYAIEVREDFMKHKDHLENVVQADLDLLFTPHGLEAHEA